MVNKTEQARRDAFEASQLEVLKQIVEQGEADFDTAYEPLLKMLATLPQSRLEDANAFLQILGSHPKIPTLTLGIVTVAIETMLSEYDEMKRRGA